ncbi:MAG: hypothetical protein JW764_04805 [Chlorobiaceae bacterium]|nr:hypothetical protein [Chlorobiaceae bacterium]
MKEVSRKFSNDPDEPQHPSERTIQQPVRQPGTAMNDLRFVVKNSLNLGFRFLSDVELLLKKIQDDKPAKEKKPEGENEKEE